MHTTEPSQIGVSMTRAGDRRAQGLVSPKTRAAPAASRTETTALVACSPGRPAVAAPPGSPQVPPNAQ